MRYTIYCDEIGNPLTDPIDESSDWDISVEVAKWIGTQYKATSLIWDNQKGYDVYLFKGHLTTEVEHDESA